MSPAHKQWKRRRWLVNINVNLSISCPKRRTLLTLPNCAGDDEVSFWFVASVSTIKGEFKENV